MRGREEQPFEEREVEFAQAAAGSIAASIVHARLREEENLKTASQVRDHLARELHDAVTQSVYSASLIAQALPAIWERAPEEGLAGLDAIAAVGPVRPGRTAHPPLRATPRDS